MSITCELLLHLKYYYICNIILLYNSNVQIIIITLFYTNFYILTI